MKQYLDLLKEVKNSGLYKKSRTDVDTISIFGMQKKYDLSKGFPLLTTKKMHWKSIVHELLWFINGDTNIKYLVDNGVNIWNEWPYEKYKKSSFYQNETLEEFVQKIKNDLSFAKKFGNLGPVYGKQWRSFNGFDQLKDVVHKIKNNPNSRRIIMSAWNPNDLDKMLLPPCHVFVQFYVNNNQLSCQLYQRSADLFLGVPFNIASYSLLTYLLAHVTGLEVGQFIHTLGDAHIYLNHVDQVDEQLKRQPHKLPKIKLNVKVKNIFEFTFDDIKIFDYNPHPSIKAKVAV